jgi:hypothetical protein
MSIETSPSLFLLSPYYLTSSPFIKGDRGDSMFKGGQGDYAVPFSPLPFGERQEPALNVLPNLVLNPALNLFQGCFRGAKTSWPLPALETVRVS